MAREYPRSFRVADQIQQELSALIRNELKDPRLPDFLTLTSVEVSRDLSVARVYFSVLQADKAQGAQQALESASGFLRRQLGSRLSLRSVPQLRFHHDRSLEEGARMSSLIDDAVKSNTTDPDSPTDSDNQATD